MIYITQLIYINEGKEETFNAFEDRAIPLMNKYNGRILYRIRPNKESFISAENELPYEIHFISFDTEKNLSAFMKDDSRLQFIHLKNDSIKSTLLIKGEKI